MGGSRWIVGILVMVLALGAAVALGATPGDLDHSFSGDGKVITPIGGGDDAAQAVAIDLKNRVVAAGSSDKGSTQVFALTRYRANGKLDDTFSGDGKVLTPVHDSGSLNAATLDARGRIVVAGFVQSDADFQFAVARYKPSGKLDKSFSGDGKVFTKFGSAGGQADAVAIDSQGRIVVGGSTFNGTDNDFAVARYKPGGKLDRSFSQDGKQVTQIGDEDFLSSLAIDAKDRVVAAGYSYNGADDDFALVRYRENGNLDHGFSLDGRVTTPIGAGEDEAGGVAIDHKGRIVAAGSTDNGSDGDFAVARYLPNGELDGSFSGDGKVTASIGSSYDSAGSMAIDKKGRIVAAGRSYNGTDYDFALARFKPAGTLDPTFSGDGVLMTPIGPGDDSAPSVRIDHDGRIVAGGRAFNGSDNDFAVARYLG